MSESSQHSRREHESSGSGLHDGNEIRYGRQLFNVIGNHHRQNYEVGPEYLEPVFFHDIYAQGSPYVGLQCFVVLFGVLAAEFPFQVHISVHVNWE